MIPLANEQQWLRDYSLLVVDANMAGLDLSELHFKFKTSQSSEEAPNTLWVRIYNLSKETVNAITGKINGVEYTRVRLRAGYQNGETGEIFDGTIKQFRKGKESAIDTYLDILAAEGDPEYNFGVVKDSLPAGSNSPKDVIAAVAKRMNLPVGYTPESVTGGVLPRGKVLWGMGRLALRNLAESQGWSWSIQDGKITMIPLNGYLPGEAVVLTRDTGLIGVPEQTDEGIKLRCLLNSKIRIGGLVKIANSTVNQTISQASNAIMGGQLPYDQWAGLQLLADVSSDGDYFAYVVEHCGDTRGNEWYSDLVCLAVDKASGKVTPYG